MAYRKDLSAPPSTPKDAVLREFGAKLTSMMTAKGWNQSDLARQATKFMPRGKMVGRDAVSNWCNAKVWPTPLALKAVAEALDTTAEELLPLVNPRQIDQLRSGMEVKSLGDGTASIYVMERVPYEVAIKIQQMVMETIRKPKKSD